ncbi:MAG: O-antigen ligase family protein [Thermoanaerobaculales bacterium]|jgi:O-antigen ligase|nr:O-antigen ligase family protein [Thermoanaerobaculales bacterium]
MTDARISPAEIPPAALVAIGLALAVPLAAIAGQPARNALLGLAGLAAIAALGLLALTASRALPGVLYAALVALVTVPVDAYLLYREHVGGWPGIRVSAADLVVLALLPIALLGRLSGVVRNRIPWSVLILYAMLLGQYLVSAIGAPSRPLALFEIASAIHALLLAAVAAAMFRREYVGVVLAIVAALVILHTGFAAAQAATGRPIGVGLGGGPAALVTESLQTGAERLRPAGLFDHPIVYANFLMLALPILAGGALGARSRLLRAGLALAAVVALLGLGLTLSRGAWISTAVAGAVMAGLAWRRSLVSPRQLRSIILLGLAAALVVGVALGPRIVERLTASQAGNLEVRFELNRIALRMIAAHPIAGVGLNSFIETMEAYDPDDVMEYFPAVVHNLYLLEAAESGLPALLLVLALMATILITARARLARVVDRRCLWLAIAILAGLCGFAVSQLADFSHRLEPLRSLLWVNIGLLYGALAAGRPDADHHLEGIEHDA